MSIVAAKDKRIAASKWTSRFPRPVRGGWVYIRVIHEDMGGSSMWKKRGLRVVLHVVKWDREQFYRISYGSHSIHVAVETPDKARKLLEFIDIVNAQEEPRR